MSTLEEHKKKHWVLRLLEGHREYGRGYNNGLEDGMRDRKNGHKAQKLKRGGGPYERGWNRGYKEAYHRPLLRRKK